MFHLKRLIWGILSAALILGCSGEKVHSQPKMNKIEIDGHDADWSDYKTKYYEKDDLRIVLGVVNDDSTLDVMIRFRDFRLARLFRHRGMTLWVNGENRKRKTLGIHFVNEAAKYMRAPSPGRFGEPGGASAPMENMRRFRGTFSLIKDEVSEIISSSGLEGVFAATDVQDGTFCYEYEIPIGVNITAPFALKAKPGDAIKLGIEIPPVSEEERQRMKERLKERGGGGMRGQIRGGSGRRGGVMRGRGLRGGAPGRQMPDLDGEQIWITVLLSNETIDKK